MEKLHERMRELLPELMELSFGCWVQFSDGEISQLTHKQVYHDRDDEVWVSWTGTLGKESTLKVTGHTPQLHHYLRVLNKSFNIASLELNGQGTCMCEMNRTSIFGDKMWRCTNFNLITGQPATEEDAEKLLELIS